MLLSRPCRITRLWSTESEQRGSKKGLGQRELTGPCASPFLSSQATLVREARRLSEPWERAGQLREWERRFRRKARGEGGRLGRIRGFLKEGRFCCVGGRWILPELGVGKP